LNYDDDNDDDDNFVINKSSSSVVAAECNLSFSCMECVAVSPTKYTNTQTELLRQIHGFPHFARFQTPAL
jgi:hypothetical protein